MKIKLKFVTAHGVRGTKRAIDLPTELIALLPLPGDTVVTDDGISLTVDSRGFQYDMIGSLPAIIVTVYLTQPS